MKLVRKKINDASFGLEPFTHEVEFDWEFFSQFNSVTGVELTRFFYNQRTSDVLLRTKPEKKNANEIN